MVKTYWFAAALFGACLGSAQAADDTIARIKSERVIRIGVRDSAAPFASLDANGQPVGFSWSLCQALVKNIEAELKLPLQVKVMPVSLTSSFELLKDGSIDLQCGSTTRTVEREARVDFSLTFFVSGIAVAHRKGDADFTSSRAYGRVAVLAGSTAADTMNKRLVAKGGASIDAVVPVRSYAEAIEKLKRKEVDTLAADNTLIPLDAAIEKRATLVTIEPYALMMRKGDRAFVDLVDRNLSKILTGPQIRQLASSAGLDGRYTSLTTEIWRRPSRDAAPQFY